MKPRHVIYREILYINRELCYKTASHHQNTITINPDICYSKPHLVFRTALDLLDPLCFHTNFRTSLSGSIKMKESKQLLIHVLIAITDFATFSLSLTLMSSFPSSPNLDFMFNHSLANVLNSPVPLSLLYSSNT